MCKCRNLLLPILTIVVGVLLLASHYGYEDYQVQTWWPILFVISGASRLAKQFCCSKKGICSLEESKGGAKNVGK